MGMNGEQTIKETDLSLRQKWIDSINDQII